MAKAQYKSLQTKTHNLCLISAWIRPGSLSV